MLENDSLETPEVAPVSLTSDAQIDQINTTDEHSSILGVLEQIEQTV